MFGLPANIDGLRQRTASNQVLTQLKILMREEVVADKFDREIWSRELTPAMTQWSKLNTVSIAILSSHIYIDAIVIIKGSELIDSKIAPPREDLDPIRAFVQLERFNAIRFIKAVDRDLQQITKFA